MRIFRPLDRYVFSEFAKIFFVTSLGLPLLLVIIDLTDNLEKYLARRLPRADIALSYLYFIPDSMFMALPAAVLFATVFSVGGFTRHSEITAAKASGITCIVPFRSVHPLGVPLAGCSQLASRAEITKVGSSTLRPSRSIWRNSICPSARLMRFAL